MLESHSLGLVFILTVFWYLYRGIQEERIRADIILAHSRNKDKEDNFRRDVGTVQMSDNMDNMDDLFDYDEEQQPDQFDQFDQ
jgi:hypothetical protein